ncbi:MAG: 30S ribosomal protein S20 [Ectothiorhodospiraceae bacterium]|nr:30S ribosomal protein S20 [Ectothiorhodospiraceae bacterium]
MANIKSARKRAVQAENNRQRNVAQRSRFRTSVKKVLKAVLAGDKTAAQAAFNEAVPMIDGAVTKGLIHKNKAARHKSRLNARVKAMQ